MEKLHIKGNWPKLMNNVISNYPELAEERSIYTRGKEENLIERLEKRTGKDREELVSWITGLSRLKL